MKKFLELIELGNIDHIHAHFLRMTEAEKEQAKTEVFPNAVKKNQTEVIVWFVRHHIVIVTAENQSLAKGNDDCEILLGELFVRQRKEILVKKAIVEGKLDQVEKYISKPTQVFVTNMFLKEAVLKGDLEIVRFLVNNAQDKDAALKDALKYSIRKKNNNLVDWFFSGDAKVRLYDFMMISEFASFETMKKMVSKIDKQNIDLVIFALVWNHVSRAGMEAEIFPLVNGSVPDAQCAARGLYRKILVSMSTSSDSPEDRNKEIFLSWLEKKCAFDIKGNIFEAACNELLSSVSTVSKEKQYIITKLFPTIPKEKIFEMLFCFAEQKKHKQFEILVKKMNNLDRVEFFNALLSRNATDGFFAYVVDEITDRDCVAGLFKLLPNNRPTLVDVIAFRMKKLMNNPSLMQQDLIVVPAGASGILASPSGATVNFSVGFNMSSAPQTSASVSTAVKRTASEAAL